MGFPGGSVVNSPAIAGDMGSNPGPGRFHMPQSNQAHTPQLLSLCSRAQEPRLLKPMCPRAPPPQQEKPLQWQARALQVESSPYSLELEKALMEQQRPNTA